MEPNAGESLEEIDRSLKERGVFKTLLLQLVKNWPVLLIALLTLVFGVRQEGINRALDQKINLNANQTTNIGVGALKTQAEAPSGSTGNVIGVSNAFKPDEWITDKFSTDSEGFYCDNVSEKDFAYWSIWSKKLISATVPIKIRFLVKNKGSASGVQPTVFVTYGEYRKNLSPLTFYRINVFDGSDARAIRLYNDKKEGIQQEYLHEQPDFVNEMTFSLQPTSAGPNVSKLILNPSLNFKANEASAVSEFKSTKEFAAVLPSVEIAGIQKQLGIGTMNGTCIKISSVDF